MDLSVTLALSSPTEHGEQLRRRQHSLSELTYSRDDDTKLETTRARLLGVLKRHEDLKERLSRYSFLCSFLFYYFPSKLMD
ncbi:uncharacterized protein LOC123439790 [Hordeum vulgare subsp. vulgare]|uniref:uncharacterized protein LOC123439790 n=1 Tax=Hordeum vulgare subsp. vulgare TaxID=112509 RepID=UPI001D1A526F|nr:uncharacterized protein LOC123439790 [Hordeum vulgare subsp. vulgare]